MMQIFLKGLYRTALTGAFLLSSGFALAGCGGVAVEHRYPESIGGSDLHDPSGLDPQDESLFGEGGILGAIGLGKKDEDEEKEDEETRPEKADGETLSLLTPASLRLPVRNVCAAEEEAEETPEAKEAEEEENEADEKKKKKKRKDKDDGDKDAPKGLSVNSYLWRATLDTLSFMPLLDSDPYGGVIITDWLAQPETPNERFKVTVYILDKKLRADGVRVNLFKQVREDGEWIDAQSNPETRLKLENAILTRARRLRVETMKE